MGDVELDMATAERQHAQAPGLQETAVEAMLAQFATIPETAQDTEAFTIEKSIEDTEALTKEDLQIQEEFAKERQKTAVEDKIVKFNVFMEMLGIIGEEFQKTAGKMQIQK